jgi:seryl-tRNA synthetase
MSKVIPLEEASRTIGEITTLDAKMNALVVALDKEKERLESNKREIQKRKNLEKENEGIELKLIELNSQVNDMKGQRDEKVKVLTDAGWVVPIPAPAVARGSISM